MKNENNEYPKIVTGVLIYNEKNEVFLARGVKWENKWAVPGGHLDWGESFEDCVRREVKEETNLEISDVEFLGIQESIFPPEYHKKKHMVFLDFCAKVQSNDVVLNPEHSEYRWFKLDDIPEDELLDSIKILIDMFKNRK